MNQKEIQKLREIYLRYGFAFARSYEAESVQVFTLKTGYFDNADIVPLCTGADTAKAFDDFSKLGFACTTRAVQTVDDAEKLLFKGFFSVESIRDRLRLDYERFTTSIVRPFSVDATYKYINAPYTINGKAGVSSPASEVVSRLDRAKPILFLIEAAAGFGKTCTAYELVHMLIELGDYLPLFSELSRNREARIFRHILLYEIDRSFPLLGSRLVQTEMKNGRVVTILDGFDELLRKAEDGTDFEKSEPMLETIGEFLTGSAKIILTTRRTVLFEGDAFHDWVEKHSNDFDLVTIKISEPKITDWLSSAQISAIQISGLNVENISNPVLLSYLRCISTPDFYKAVSDPDRLVDSYFEFMLDREQERQDLRITVFRQHEILQNIASDMLEVGYTSEHRDRIVDFILSTMSKYLDEALIGYSTGERPTKEELANKLASHALLDRSAREPNKIGFINDFVLGHYIALSIMKKKDWLSDDLRFIEPAVLSYQPRDKKTRNALWDHLYPSTDFLSVTDKISIAIKLERRIAFPLLDGDAVGLSIDDILIGEAEIRNFQFNECVFKSCIFDVDKFNSVTFLNCRFYGNLITKPVSPKTVYVLGALGDEDFIAELSKINVGDEECDEFDRQTLLKRFILEKFWPVGRLAILHKHRPIKVLCTNSSEFKPDELYAAIEALRKDGLLLETKSTQFVEINFERRNDIKRILESGYLNE